MTGSGVDPIGEQVGDERLISIVREIRATMVRSACCQVTEVVMRDPSDSLS